MANFIFSTILWTFALYGILHFLFHIFKTYYKYRLSSEGIYMFIAVKNQENKIEGFLRSLIFKLIYLEDENPNNIFVIDLNSSDKTAEILDMLSSDCEYIKYTDLKHCKKILDTVSKEK